ncbi:protein of unknown function [Candidatus Methylocalor cossyra]|uniref:Uncharacterized protein n=1 Tax=Candidatus Methylocalor cossyra TaxID=3108543 RepID=A0ABM9NIG6_9GAMM
MKNRLPWRIAWCAVGEIPAENRPCLGDFNRSRAARWISTEKASPGKRESYQICIALYRHGEWIQSDTFRAVAAGAGFRVGGAKPGLPRVRPRLSGRGR